jgi:hypothetical protein
MKKSPNCAKSQWLEHTSAFGARGLGRPRANEKKPELREEPMARAHLGVRATRSDPSGFHFLRALIACVSSGTAWKRSATSP